MRILRIAAPTAALAVAAGGVAVAAGGGNTPKTDEAAATFTATTSDKSKTRTCEGRDGTYNLTHGVYRGTSSGDARLTGDIVVRTRTLVNTDTGLGTTTGRVFLKRDGRRVAVAGLKAVNTQSGKLDGFLSGHARKTEGRGTSRLFANFSAAFNASGSELNGELGSELPVLPENSAVFQDGRCRS